jgi:hypothetical protein
VGRTRRRWYAQQTTEGHSYVGDGHEAIRLIDAATREPCGIRAELIGEIRDDEDERAARVDHMIAEFRARWAGDLPGDGRRNRWSAWLAFWTGVAASVLANVLAAEPSVVARVHLGVAGDRVRARRGGHHARRPRPRGRRRRGAGQLAHPNTGCNTSREQRSAVESAAEWWNGGQFAVSKACQILDIIV